MKIVAVTVAGVLLAAVVAAAAAPPKVLKRDGGNYVANAIWKGDVGAYTKLGFRVTSKPAGKKVKFMTWDITCYGHPQLKGSVPRPVTPYTLWRPSPSWGGDCLVGNGAIAVKSGIRVTVEILGR